MPKPGYFFYGEEMYPANKFAEELITKLDSGNESTPDVERFDLKSDTWAEIIDSARTAPLLFSSTRLLVVKAPGRKKPNIPSSHEELSDNERQLLQEYFSSPSPGTVMVIMFPGKIKRFSGLVRFFESLGRNVTVRPLYPYKDYKLSQWINERIKQEEMSISGEAVQRLIELNGSELALLDQELEKLVVFMGEKKRIEREHVDEVSGWGKAYLEWDFTDHLETGDYADAVKVLDRLLGKEGLHPIQIVNLTAGFLQNILLAKLRLEEGKKDRKGIFREIYPNIKENYRDLYERKFKRLFTAAESLAGEDIRELTARLRDVDFKLKSTGLPFQPLMEEWIYRLCRILDKRIQPLHGSGWLE